MTIELERHLTYYMLQLYAPSFLFVFIAWTTMYFPTNPDGIKAQYNVQITNLISMSVETKVFSKSLIGNQGIC